MDTQHTHTQMDEKLGVLWALVLIQGGILVVSTIESLVANAAQGFGLIGVSVLTGVSAVLALYAARGLRRRRLWARRLTLVAESFVLALGVIELVATQFLDNSGLDLVPVLTGVVVPVAVLVLMRTTKPLFFRQSANSELEVAVEVVV